MARNSTYDGSGDIPEDLRDISQDNIEILEGGELGNMFLVRVNGELKKKANTKKNRLLYKHGLYSLLTGSSGRTVLQKDPLIAIEPTTNDNVYAIWHGSDSQPVLTPPSKAEKVLQGVLDAIEKNNVSNIKEVHQYVIENQVRRDVVNKLINLFPHSVIKTNEGWTVEGMFLVTWEASVYLVTSDLSEGSYTISGGVSKIEEKKQFLKLTPQETPEESEITIEGETYELTELEKMFFARVQYLLEFKERVEDDAFYEVIKRHIADQRNITS